MYDIVYPTTLCVSNMQLAYLEKCCRVETLVADWNNE